jgi:hypothetical protein
VRSRSWQGRGARCFSPRSSAFGRSREGQSCELVAKLAPYDIKIAPEALRSACQTRYRRRWRRLFSRRCYQDDSSGTVREANLREPPTGVLWHLIRSTCNETRRGWDELNQNLPSSTEVATKDRGRIRTGLGVSTVVVVGRKSRVMTMGDTHSWQRTHCWLNWRSGIAICNVA